MPTTVARERTQYPSRLIGSGLLALRVKIVPRTHRPAKDAPVQTIGSRISVVISGVASTQAVGQVVQWSPAPPAAATEVERSMLNASPTGGFTAGRGRRARGASRVGYRNLSGIPNAEPAGLRNRSVGRGHSRRPRGCLPQYPSNGHQPPPIHRNRATSPCTRPLSRPPCAGPEAHRPARHWCAARQP